MTTLQEAQQQAANDPNIEIERRGNITLVRQYRYYRRRGRQLRRLQSNTFFFTDSGLRKRATFYSYNKKGDRQGRTKINYVKGTRQNFSDDNVKREKPTVSASVAAGTRGAGAAVPTFAPTITRESDGRVIQQGGQVRTPKFGAERPSSRIVYTAKRPGSGNVVQFTNEARIPELEKKGFVVKTMTLSPGPRKETRGFLGSPLTTTTIETITGSARPSIERSAAMTGGGLVSAPKVTEQLKVTTGSGAQSVLLSTSTGESKILTSPATFTSEFERKGQTVSIPASAWRGAVNFNRSVGDQLKKNPTIGPGIQFTRNVVVDAGQTIKDAGVKIQEGGPRDQSRFQEQLRTDIGGAWRLGGATFKVVGRTAFDTPLTYPAVYGTGALAGKVFANAQLLALSSNSTVTRSLGIGTLKGLQVALPTVAGATAYSSIKASETPFETAADIGLKTVVGLKGFKRGQESAFKDVKIVTQPPKVLLTKQGGTTIAGGRAEFNILGKTRSIPYQEGTLFRGLSTNDINKFSQGFKFASYRVLGRGPGRIQSFDTGLLRIDNRGLVTQFESGAGQGLIATSQGKFPFEFRNQFVTGSASGGRGFVSLNTPSGSFTQVQSAGSTPTGGLFVAGTSVRPTGINFQPTMPTPGTMFNPVSGLSGSSNVNLFNSGTFSFLPSVLPLPTSTPTILPTFGASGAQSNITPNITSRYEARFDTTPRPLTRSFLQSSSKTTPTPEVGTPSTSEVIGLTSANSISKTIDNTFIDNTTTTVNKITIIGSPQRIPIIGGGFGSAIFGGGGGGIRKGTGGFGFKVPDIPKPSFAALAGGLKGKKASKLPFVTGFEVRGI